MLLHSLQQEESNSEHRESNAETTVERQDLVKEEDAEQGTRDKKETKHRRDDTHRTK